MIEFVSEESPHIDSLFNMSLSDGSIKRVRLDDQRFYSCFYSHKEFCDKVKPPSCTLLDIDLAKEGLETIAESFYNSMLNQQQTGRRSNATLGSRTKVNCCLLSSKNCNQLIKEAVFLYLHGDKDLP